MIAKPVWRNTMAALALGAAAAFLTGCGGGNTDAAQGGNEPQNPVVERGWELVWADEFSGSALNTANWNIQTGDGTAEGIPGWGNNELQTYQAANIAVSGGNLVITARQETVGRHNYTSARINTSGKMDMSYGRVEARIRPPGGQGLWSAFWMLPTDSPYGTWAAGGEIDIMEVYSRDPAPFTLGAVHYGMAWPLNKFSSSRYTGIDPADGFHTYALEWDEDEVRWFVDGTHFQTARNTTYWTYYRDAETNAHTPGPASAPFDQPFHLLLNVAVGGNLPGPPVPSAFPGQMLVDYVRVYRCNIPTAGVDCAGFADLVDPGVEPFLPGDVFRAEYQLYGDMLGPLAFPNVEETVALAFGVWDNNGAFALSEVSLEDRGMVIDISTTGGGNVSIFAQDTSRQSFFGMGSAGEPGNYAGEIQFDLFVFSEGTDAESGLQVKIDSLFPDLGFVELAVADLPKDEWTTVTVQISDIAHNPGHFGGGPVDLDKVLSLFVLEPTGAAHLQVDNVKIRCGHPSDGGCGIKPPKPPRVGPLPPQPVFVDAVDPLWDNGIRGADSGSGWADYTDNANSDNKSQWDVVDAADPARGKIIDVTFAGGDAVGVWFIQASGGVDLSDYATGEVRFDIKVDDYGANDAGMTMKIDCIFPCTSGDQGIGKVGDGAWETVRIPVSRLLSGGLNLGSVNTGIVVFPTSQRVAQNFQLDNIQWHGGEEDGGPPGEDLVLYEDGLSPNWFLWDCCGGATFAEVDDDEAHGKVVEIRFGAGGTVTGFQAVDGVDASGLANATLRFDFKEVSAPPEGSLWRVKLESSNAATAVEVLITDAGNPQPGADWQSYSFDLATDFGGLDLSDLKLVLFFPDWQNADGAVGRFDNVRVVAAP